MSQQYDIMLFGVTGFTGRLAAEYLLEKKYAGVKWGVCGRSADKIKQVMGELSGGSEIPVEVCDLVCGGDADKLAILKSVVSKTKVVITTAGPFEKYGQELVGCCADLGVHYADITGETDFVRKVIAQNHDKCKTTGSTIVNQCGHDCIPWDLAVFLLHKEAQKQGKRIKDVRTFGDLCFEPSGGTLATVQYQMTKARDKGDKSVDPLNTSMESAASASKYSTKVENPKSDIVVPEVDNRYAGSWVMGAVMANCVRRSNALLGYNEELTYADAKLRGNFLERCSDNLSMARTGLGIVLGTYVHSWFQKPPGDGPSRESMSDMFLRVHALAKLEDGSELRLCYEIPEDPGYLNTAKMLVESGMVLLKSTSKPAGVVTPAAAFGTELTDRLCAESRHKISFICEDQSSDQSSVSASRC